MKDQNNTAGPAPTSREAPSSDIERALMGIPVLMVLGIAALIGMGVHHERTQLQAFTQCSSALLTKAGATSIRYDLYQSHPSLTVQNGLGEVTYPLGGSNEGLSPEDSEIKGKLEGCYLQAYGKQPVLPRDGVDLWAKAHAFH